jgi:ribonuclease J
MSERAVGDRIDKIFADHPKNRIIIATFASNVDRVQEIVNAAQKYNRKVIIEGRSMVSIFDIAQKLGYLEVPDNIMVDIEEIGNYTDEQICLITTGSQGEAMAALSRMASSAHKKVSIFPGDTIIFSSNPIPGNEKAVTKVINDLYDKDAEVIFENTHVSGHACQEEIKLIYTLTKPKYAIPVHGEVRHLKEHAKLCKSLGMDNEHIFVLHSGDVLKLSPKKGKIVDKVVAGEVMVDGLGVGDVGNIVLRDRQSLSENGIMIVVMTLERYGSRILAGPDIVSRGFVYVRESEDLIYEAQTVVREALERCLGSGVNDWGRIKTVIRDTLSEFLWKKIKRSPMIIPIIMEVD